MASYTDPKDVGRQDSLRLCPACRDYTEAATCPFDATPTIDVHALERPRDRRLGRRIDDRYEIVSAQERAGFGDLYLATDTREGRDVSLKIFAADLCRSEDQAARFVLAAQRGAALKERATVRVLAVGHCPDGAYLVLEPLSGETLARRLDRCGRLDVKATAKMAAEVARSLSEAHRGGLAHQALTAHTIFLSRGTDAIRVLDYGVSGWAIRLGSAIETALGVGTPILLGDAHTMAPEALSGEAPTARSDLYSLGAIVFRALAGHAPYEGATPLAVRARALAGDLPALPPDIPEPLRHLVSRLLAADPQRRPRRITDVADLLEDVAEGRLDDAARRDLAAEPLPAVTLPDEPTVVPTGSDPRQSRVDPAPARSASGPARSASGPPRTASSRAISAAAAPAALPVGTASDAVRRVTEASREQLSPVERARRAAVAPKPPARTPTESKAPAETEAPRRVVSVPSAAKPSRPSRVVSVPTSRDDEHERTASGTIIVDVEPIEDTVFEPEVMATVDVDLTPSGRAAVVVHPGGHVPAAPTPKADPTLLTPAVPVRSHSAPAIVDVEIVESVEVRGEEIGPAPAAEAPETEGDGGWVGPMVVQPRTATAPPRSASPIPDMPGAYVPDTGTTLHVPRRDPSVPPKRRGRPEPPPERPPTGFGRTFRLLALVAIAAGAVVGTTVYTTLTPYLPDPHPGAINITSTPSDATLVHVHSGRFIGMTPVTMFGWPNTPAEVRLLKPAHRPSEIELQFPKRGDAVDSHVKLWPVPRVLVASEPLGATVRHVETHKTLGRTPIRWEVPNELGETVTLEFVLPGYDPHTLELRPIDVRAQQPVWVDFDAVQPPID